jgi:hypothetical protein
LDKRLRNTDAEIGIMIVGCKNKEHWEKTGMYINVLLWLPSTHFFYGTIRPHVFFPTTCFGLMGPSAGMLR